jgi:hypothetical protein
MYSRSSAKEIKTYTHFVDGRAALADDNAPKKMFGALILKVRFFRVTR